jgi:hypothetical protein
MQEQNPGMKLTLHKPEGTGRVSRLAVRWLDSVEENLKTIGVRNWRRKSQDRDQESATVKEVEVFHGVYSPKKTV